MKQEHKPMTWIVKNFDQNTQKIIDYDVLKYRENDIKKLKKKCTTKEEFAESLRREMQYTYWSRAEYELVIEIDENNHIWLNPWCGCYKPENVRIDVTDDESFDWKGFSEEHINKQIYKNKAKVDIYSQLTYKDQFEKLVDYYWNYHHKWQRNKR